MEEKLDFEGGAADTFLTAEALRKQNKSAPSSAARKVRATSPNERSMKSAESASAMLDVKINRKRAEQDLQLLANRIALLRTEEQRTLSKISETKNRAKEVLDHKKRQEDKLQEKFYGSMGKEGQVRAIQAKVAVDKVKRKESQAMSKKLLTDERQQNANRTKDASRRILEEAQNLRDRAVLENKLKAEVSFIPQCSHDSVQCAKENSNPSINTGGEEERRRRAQEKGAREGGKRA